EDVLQQRLGGRVRRPACRSCGRRNRGRRGRRLDTLRRPCSNGNVSFAHEFGAGWPLAKPSLKRPHSETPRPPKLDFPRDTAQVSFQTEEPNRPNAEPPAARQTAAARSSQLLQLVESYRFAGDPAWPPPAPDTLPGPAPTPSPGSTSRPPPPDRCP